MRVHVWDFGLLHRWFFASQDRAGASFASTVERWAQECDYSVLALDSEGPTWRHCMFPAYKATRTKRTEAEQTALAQQQAIAVERLGSSGVRVRHAEGFEADDVVATVSRQAVEAGHSVLVFSADKDLAQLLPRVELHDGKAYVTVRDTEAKHGIYLDQLLDYFAIVGDSSDNVPGVPGMGPAAARKILGAHESVAAALEAGRRRPWDKLLGKLIDHEQDFALARALIRLDDHAPVVKGASQRGPKKGQAA